MSPLGGSVTDPCTHAAVYRCGHAARRDGESASRATCPLVFTFGGGVAGRCVASPSLLRVSPDSCVSCVDVHTQRERAHPKTYAQKRTRTTKH
eukprot:7379500-Prymnesium_polylepis.1